MQKVKGFFWCVFSICIFLNLVSWFCCISQLFLFVFLQLRVNDYNYVACGNSTNKKDAMKNAAKDFIQFLIRSEAMDVAETHELGGVSDSL